MRKLLFIALVSSAFISGSCHKHQIKHTVQYFISGKSNMNIRYNDVSGEFMYSDNVSSAWKYAFNAPGDGRFVSLNVTSADGSAVSGSILVDGQEAAVGNSNTGSVTMTTRLP